MIQNPGPNITKVRQEPDQNLKACIPFLQSRPDRVVTLKKKKFKYQLRQSDVEDECNPHGFNARDSVGFYDLKGLFQLK